MDGPRFITPHAPKRHGTSHTPDADERPGDRLKLINKVMNRFVAKRQQQKQENGSSAGKQTKTVKVVGAAAQQQLYHQNQQQKKLRPPSAGPTLAKEDFVSARYNKHSMKVADNWTGPTSDFSLPVSREERQKAQKHYVSHTNDLTYFPGSDDDVFDPRRRCAKPSHRILGGRNFGTYPTRDQRALNGRGVTIRDREAILRHIHEAQDPKSAAKRSTSQEAAGTRDGGGATAQQESTAEVHPTATTSPAKESHVPNNVESPTAAASGDSALQDLTKDVRGTPSFERSLHTSMSRKAQAVLDEAMLWSSGTKAALLNDTHNEWVPFSLGPYNTDKKVEQRLTAPSFATMSNHYGYESQLKARRPHSAGVSRSSSEMVDESKYHLLAPHQQQRESGMVRHQVAKEEGLRHVVVDKRVTSVPDFSKALGKDSRVTGYNAREPVRDVDFGLSVNFDHSERHLRTIDLAKSAMRPAPRQVAYSTHMKLFPKYDVVDLPAKSPRIGPKKRPGSAPAVRSQQQHPRYAQTLTPSTSGKPKAGLSDGSDTMRPSFTSTSHSPTIRTKKETKLGKALAFTSTVSNDDIVHPKLTRDIRFGRPASAPSHR